MQSSSIIPWRMLRDESVSKLTTNKMGNFGEFEIRDRIDEHSRSTGLLFDRSITRFRSIFQRGDEQDAFVAFSTELALNP